MTDTLGSCLIVMKITEKYRCTSSLALPLFHEKFNGYLTIFSLSHFPKPDNPHPFEQHTVQLRRLSTIHPHVASTGLVNFALICPHHIANSRPALQCDRRPALLITRLARPIHIHTHSNQVQPLVPCNFALVAATVMPTCQPCTHLLFHDRRSRAPAARPALAPQPWRVWARGSAQ